MEVNLFQYPDSSLGWPIIGTVGPVLAQPTLLSGWLIYTIILSIFSVHFSSYCYHFHNRTCDTDGHYRDHNPGAPYNDL